MHIYYNNSTARLVDPSKHLGISWNTDYCHLQTEQSTINQQLYVNTFQQGKTHTGNFCCLTVNAICTA